MTYDGPNKQATLILKCTRQCNLKCSYCLDRHNNPKTDMDLNLIAQIISQTGTDPNLESVGFIWHGGEPLLMGLPFFRKIQFIQENVFQKDKCYTNKIQTNGTLLDSNWINFFKANNYTVGVSLDIPKIAHNATRPFSNGENTYDRVLQSINELKRNKMRYGILCVITPNHINLGPEKLFSSLRNGGLKSCGLLSLRFDKATKDTLIEYNHNYGKYMADIFTLWAKEDDPSFKIRELMSRLDLFFGLPHSLCKDSGSCVGDYFGIEADGSVWHCDKFREDPRFYLGNIFEQTITEIKASSRMEQLLELEKSIRSKCETCQWYHICGGGCLFDTLCLLEAGGRIGTSDCLNYNLLETISSFLAKSKTFIEALVNSLDKTQNVPLEI